MSIEQIKENIGDYNFLAFKQHYKTADAVIRNFEIIGESAKKVPLEIKRKYPEVPWNEIYLLKK